MKKRIVHLKMVDEFWGTQSACNQLYSTDPRRVTTDKNLVTCKNCEKMEISKMEKHFKLDRISEKQAKIIIDALDLYSRLLSGQLEEIENFFRWNMIDRVKPEDFHAVESAIDVIKKSFFPELTRNSSYGITGEGTPDESKIAYDILRVLRYCVAWAKNPNGGIQVDFHKPDFPYGSEKFVIAKIREEEE